MQLEHYHSVSLCVFLVMASHAQCIDQNLSPIPSFVIGMSTISRGGQPSPYLLDTIDKVLNAKRTDKNELTCTPFAIVILSADGSDEDRNISQSRVRERFPKEVESGKIALVSMGNNTNWYPPSILLAGIERCSLKRNYGDKMSRVLWRSKLLLDSAYIMKRAYERAQDTGAVYYLHLEDDTPPLFNDWLDKISRFLQVHSKENWGLIHSRYDMKNDGRKEFKIARFGGAYGYIAKVVDIPKIVDFLVNNYDEAPYDWLLGDFWSAGEKGPKRIHYQILPGIFEHKGHTSTLHNWQRSDKDIDSWERCDDIEKVWPGLKDRLSKMRERIDSVKTSHH